MTSEQKEIEELKALVSSLLARIAEMEAEISRLKSPRKDSSNSSIPPSSDPFRNKKTESLRIQSTNKPGGQSGHPGNALLMVEHPTEAVHHIPDYCSVCGCSLQSASPHFLDKRQLIDIPAIALAIIEHHIFEKRCSCGHCQV